MSIDERPDVARFRTHAGRTVYRLPVEAFHNHYTNCYLVMDDPLILIDTGSGFDSSNRGLLAAFEAVQDRYGDPIQLSDVALVVLTHAHIDHFGGLNFVAQHAPARIAAHELDVSTIAFFGERLGMATKNLHLFLDRAGLPPERVAQLLTMNKWSKDLFRAVPIDVAFREGPVPGTPLRAYHAPGHCPGQVCLQLDDLLFTADHILPRTTPHQSPESITRYTGLGHFFDALHRIAAIDGVVLGLGGHEAPIVDVAGRIGELLAFHERRLGRVIELCQEPQTVVSLSKGLFGRRDGYHVLLALLETGAHVEYLYERGRLSVVNLDEAEQAYNPVLRYRAV